MWFDAALHNLLKIAVVLFIFFSSEVLLVLTFLFLCCFLCLFFLLFVDPYESSEDEDELEDELELDGSSGGDPSGT